MTTPNITHRRNNNKFSVYYDLPFFAAHQHLMQGGTRKVVTAFVE